MPDLPIPVILDTDIGGDIDDTWALGFMLKCPEIDLKMVVTDTGNTDYRSRVTARYLQLCGRSDIPVAVGIRQNDEDQGQAAWVAGYTLDHYPGTVYPDGVAALVEAIMASPVPLTLVCIGPMPNIAAALKAEPQIAGRCHFIGMHGSIRCGLFGQEGAVAEYNVVADAPACQAVFAAPWLSKTITPLDTCGCVQLKGDLYQQVLASDEDISQYIIENYLAWCGSNQSHDPAVESSILFDTVAAWLVFSRQYLEMQPLMLSVTDDGFTVIDEVAGSLVDTAVAWADLDGYQAELVRRLTTKG